MGRFSSRFSDDDDDDDSRPTKPECYGDPDYYDITDDECKRCRFKGTCKLKVAALEREERRNQRGDQTQGSGRSQSSGKIVKRKSREYELEEADGQDTFLSVLAYNSSLNAATTMAETLTDALGQIPRKRYPSLKKRKVED
jgi:hypothetical protein